MSGARQIVRFISSHPRIHDVGHLRRGLKIHEVYSVNLSTSTVESSSCHCSMILYGEKSRSMLADSLAVVGHYWDLDQKRHGTRLVPINQTESGTELQQ